MTRAVTRAVTRAAGLGCDSDARMREAVREGGGGGGGAGLSSIALASERLPSSRRLARPLRALTKKCVCVRLARPLRALVKHTAVGSTLLR